MNIDFVTILMPCLNEEKTIGNCIKKAQQGLRNTQLNGEIVVADNNSEDRSAEIAESMGARVVHVEQKGYGSAIRAGIAASRGEYIIMGDADDSYDFTNISDFILKLEEGYDLVMGNRFTGGIEAGAMPWSHRYVGNPLLSGLGRMFFKTDIGDFHCGMRAFRKEAIWKIELCTNGMEFASEMVVKSLIHGLRITEVPVKLYPDGRDRAPHLRTIPDGWRHLKFLLIYSPKWLFLYPGILMSLVGGIGVAVLSVTTVRIGQANLEITSMFYFALLFLIGVETIQFSLFTRIYGKRIGQFPQSSRLSDSIELVMTKYGFLAAILLVLVGTVGILSTFIYWSQIGFGDMPDTWTHRRAILFGTLFMIGIGTFFSSFFVNALHMGDEKWL